MRLVVATLFAVVVASCAVRPASAQVTRLEILSREPMAPSQAVAAAGPYELIRGRVHGEIDPADRRNAIIQDLALAPRNTRGRVEYVATFALTRPVDLAKASGVLIYSVVNRGNGAPASSADGHVWLVSGWQGDLPPAPDKQTIAVPVARTSDGSPITGRMIARFANAAPGTTTLPIRHATIGNPPPAYPPAGLEQPDARLISIGHESATGVQRDVRDVPRTAWAFADCRTTSFPGTPDATQVCVKGGFDPARLYQLSYTVRDPLVLGVGLAATRDITAFFRGAAADGQGAPNPVAGAIRHAVAIGDSQSGNFIRTFIHLGFNEGADGRAVWDGAFPRIAARQTPMNVRFGVPGGAASLFEAGSEPAIWWGRYEDRSRGRRPASLLDRCTASHTCPKIIEAFGSAEFWGLRMSPDLVGTDARADIPLPANVRRYYYPGTTHGGGRGGFAIEPAPAPAGCTLPANPNPEADTTRALTNALVEWVVRDTAPPESRYPRLARGQLVPPTAVAATFARIPGARDPVPLLNPVLDYEFGPGLVLNDLTGVLRAAPPRVRRVLPSLVPRVGPDGNELDGVASVLHQAPLGTYLGWNAFAGGFFKDQGCGFSGGYLPFARTRAERLTARDPRPSLEERYQTHDGYVRAVRTAAETAVSERFLLRADADRLIVEAGKSDVLAAQPAAKAAAMSTCDLPAIAARLDGAATVLMAAVLPDRDACQVKATASSGPGSLITFEVWVPTAWNGKLVATGNGGFSNAINTGDMTHALSQGYAAVGGDTGHQGATPDDLLWGVDAPERILDWGTRSVHTILGPAKRIVEAVGGRAPRRTYFYGCSTGGHQGFALLQRYPQDVDGVIAGAPGANRVRLNAAFLARFLANHRPGDAAPILPPAKLPIITRAVVAACDANDGVTDGIVDDPRACRFDPAVLACRAGDGPSCLTEPQLGALRRLYDGLRSVASGTLIYPGWPKSSEALTSASDGRPQIGWHQYWGGAEPARAAFWRRWVFRDPAWDWWQFDPDRDLAVADATVGAAIDQTSDDLRTFQARGGKVIVYHGWQDPVVNPLDTIAYYERVRRRLGLARPIDRFFRLFLVPGMGHCGGGPGATCFGNQQSPSPIVDADHDLLMALDAWVERGRAPDRIVASRVEDGATVRTRPLCPYPQKATYARRGSTDAAANFACR
ncbi:MAG: tannase/feruloyl esterase family alpha/beta hydrolase [Vicinamibacteraceae bacterium]